jgi:hypothetical protein
MGRIYVPPKVITDIYGRPNVVNKSSVEFNHLIGMRVSDVVLFDDSTNDLIESGTTILPRHHSIFVGTKDGEIQYKPYEYNPHRIVVSTYKGIIISIDSLG